MSQFVSELWESVFTPGVTPTLLKATYGAFVMLIAVLSVLLFFTRNIHVLALLVVSFCLIGSLVWFLQELEAAKAAGKIQSKEHNEDIKTTSPSPDDKKDL